MIENIYHVLYKINGIIYKSQILFATCKVEFRFNGTSLDNVKEIISQKESGFNNEMFFDCKQKKLSNLGHKLYISMQNNVDIITLNDEVIYSTFKGDKLESDSIKMYFKNAKEI